MTTAVYAYFVSFVYHWVDVFGNKGELRFGSLEIEMGTPVRRHEHIIDMQRKAKEVLNRQQDSHEAADVIVLNYVLLRFAQEGVRAVMSPSTPASQRARKRKHKKTRAPFISKERDDRAPTSGTAAVRLSGDQL